MTYYYVARYNKQNEEILSDYYELYADAYEEYKKLGGINDNELSIVQVKETSIEEELGI